MTPMHKTTSFRGVLALGCLSLLVISGSGSGCDRRPPRPPESGSAPAASSPAAAPPAEKVPTAPSSDSEVKSPALTTAAKHTDDAEPSEGEDDKWPAMGVVYATGLNLRPDPSTKGTPRAVMHCGQAVRITGRTGPWYHVDTHQGEGWASVSWVLILDPQKGHLPPCRDYASFKPASRPKVQPKLPVVPTPPPNPPSEKVAVAVDPQPAVPKPDGKSKPSGAPPPPPPPKPPAEIRLSTAGVKAPVLFTHAKHNGERKFACVKCHHSISDGTRQLTGEANDEKACRLCHSRQPSPPVHPAHNNAYAFHKACIDCHTIKGAGPTQCNECHNPANAAAK